MILKVFYGQEMTKLFGHVMGSVMSVPYTDMMKVILCHMDKVTRDQRCQVKKEGRIYKLCIVLVTTHTKRKDMIAKLASLGPSAVNATRGTTNTYELKKPLCCEPSKAKPDCTGPFKAVWADRGNPQNGSPKTWDRVIETSVAGM